MKNLIILFALIFSTGILADDIKESDIKKAYEAARNNDVKTMQELIAKGLDVNVKPKSFRGERENLLTEAARNNAVDVVSLLIANGAEVDARNGSGTTALMYLAQRGNIEGMELVLNAGADITAVTSRGRPVLGFVAEISDDLLKGKKLGLEGSKVIMFLLSKGAPYKDINASYGRKTLLMHAAAVGDTRVIEDLISKGADIDLKAPSGKTALLVAIDNGAVEAIKTLVIAGADVNAKDRTGKSVLEYLFEYEGEIGPLSEFLLSNGAMPLNSSITELEERLIAAVKKNELKAVNGLIASGADLDVKDAEGCPVIVHAAKNGMLSMLKLLLKSGANIEATDSNGKTAIVSAMEAKDLDIVRFLQSRGAKFDAGNAAYNELLNTEAENNPLNRIRAYTGRPTLPSYMGDEAETETNAKRSLFFSKRTPTSRIKDNMRQYTPPVEEPVKTKTVSDYLSKDVLTKFDLTSLIDNGELGDFISNAKDSKDVARIESLMEKISLHEIDIDPKSFDLLTNCFKKFATAKKAIEAAEESGINVATGRSMLNQYTGLGNDATDEERVLKAMDKAAEDLKTPGTEEYKEAMKNFILPESAALIRAVGYVNMEGAHGSYMLDVADRIDLLLGSETSRVTGSDLELKTEFLRKKLEEFRTFRENKLLVK